MRRAGTFARAAVLLLVLLVGFVAWNRVFLGRLLTFPHDTPILSVEWYQPKERVPGGFEAPLPVAAPAEVGLRPEALERAAAWAEERRSAALLVMRHGRVVFERAFGDHALDRPTNSYSMAKTVLGLLVGVALEEGAFRSLDDRVGTFLPEWADDPRGAIRLDDLLQMQSGLENDDDRMNPLSAMVRTHLSDDAVPPVLGLGLVRPPGEAHDYNNLNSLVLGVCLERATGERYAAYFSSRLWEPIGARDAAVWLDRAGGVAKTYCCVFAVTRDWARLGEMMCRGGERSGRRVVPAAWIERMIAPSRHEPRYGRHVWRHPGDDVVPPFFYLDGGRKQRVYVLRTHDLVIVRVGEQTRGWDDLALPRFVLEGIDE